MPPPVDPVLQTMQERNSIQVGANTGQRLKSCEVMPEVVASDTTLNSECRIAERPGYTSHQVSSTAMNTTLTARTEKLALDSTS